MATARSLWDAYPDLTAGMVVARVSEGSDSSAASAEHRKRLSKYIFKSKAQGILIELQENDRNTWFDVYEHSQSLIASHSAAISIRASLPQTTTPLLRICTHHHTGRRWSLQHYLPTSLPWRLQTTSGKEGIPDGLLDQNFVIGAGHGQGSLCGFPGNNIFALGTVRNSRMNTNCPRVCISVKSKGRKAVTVAPCQGIQGSGMQIGRALRAEVAAGVY